MDRLSENLREALEEEVATGKLLPGAHLDEVELARRFGMSRTPVREALRLLAGEGLVEIRPRRGTVVAQVSPQRLLEMFEVMAELETMCARLAARRMTEVELQNVDDAHEECRIASAGRESDAYFYANERFHQSIYLAAHNGFLNEQSLVLQRKLRPYRRLQLRVHDRVNRSFAEHQGILEALRRRDPDAASTAIRSHILVQGERFTDLVAELNRMETALPRGR